MIYIAPLIYFNRYHILGNVVIGMHSGQDPEHDAPSSLAESGNGKGRDVNYSKYFHNFNEDPVTFFAKNKDGPVKFVYLNRVS